MAADHQGAVAYADLRGAGLTRGAIDHRVGRGRLHRRHRGVYLVGHEVPADRAPLFAATLALGPDAYVRHRSALEQHGVLAALQGPVHVTVVGRCRRSRAGIRVHRTTRIAPEDLGTLAGLRITSPARAILDFADTATPRELERAVNEAHVQRLATPQDLHDVLGRTPGRRGAALLRKVLDRHDGPTKLLSDGEEVLRDALRHARITGFATNVVVHGYMVDFYFPERDLVVEVDSGRYHGTPAALNEDRRRDAHLRSHGLEVLRYSWWQVTGEIHFVIAEIAAKSAADRA